MDQLTALRVFVAAVEEGSLAGAGRRLNLSPAVAGKYVADIESRLNSRLLHRTTRRLNLTDAGQNYYTRCRHILEAYDEANLEASDHFSNVQGTLSVSVPTTFGEQHLAPLLPTFLLDNPQLNIDVRLSDHYVDLRQSNVDMAIRIGKLADSDLVARPLAPCKMVICASPDYLALFHQPQKPSDLSSMVRLAFSDAVSAGDWRLLNKDGVSHQIAGPCRMVSNNIEMLRQSALAGVGIVYGPTFAFGEDIKAGRLVSVLDDYKLPELTIQAVYASRHYVPMKVRCFIQYLQTALSHQPEWDDF